MASHADDLAAFLRQLDGGRTRCGMSYGGAIGILLAVQHPEWVNSLFLYEPGLATHALSDPVERERLMLPFMTAWTRYGLLFGEVYVTAGRVEASAIWLPPDAVIRTPEHREQACVTAVVDAFSDGARARLDAILQHLGRIREAAASVPPWYLFFIGVDPARQGLVGLDRPSRRVAMNDAVGRRSHP